MGNNTKGGDGLLYWPYNYINNSNYNECGNNFFALNTIMTGQIKYRENCLDLSYLVSPDKLSRLVSQYLAELLRVLLLKQTELETKLLKIKRKTLT